MIFKKTLLAGLVSGWVGKFTQVLRELRGGGHTCSAESIESESSWI